MTMMILSVALALSLMMTVARDDDGADEPVGGDGGISSGGASGRTGLVGSES